MQIAQKLVIIQLKLRLRRIDQINVSFVCLCRFFLYKLISLHTVIFTETGCSNFKLMDACTSVV